MEAMLGRSLQFATWIDSNKLERTKLRSSLRVSSRMRTDERSQVIISSHSQWNRASTLRVAWKAMSHTCRNSPGSVLQSESFPASFDDNEILESKAEEIKPNLDGRCIFLVGMMASGKTTIGEILSMSLGYSFFDCDALIEQAVGGTPVAEIFKLHGEGFFRDNETEVLRKLSVMRQLVVSTGGGAVVRPINWKYMQKGITVWLDVPLEALARRIAAVGTQSRPLLEQESGNEYSKAFTRLSTLWEERGKSYANANARVSLENIAAKLGYVDVCNLSPTVIAIEVLEQVESFLKSK